VAAERTQATQQQQLALSTSIVGRDAETAAAVAAAAAAADNASCSQHHHQDLNLQQSWFLR
jgi:hypothetical protein